MKTSAEYYKLAADEIYDDVNETNQEVIKSEVEGVNFVVFPHVYPSQKFRTTSFVLKNLKDLIKGKKVCDMGCGPGIVGLFSLQNGASQVVQADINPSAVENAKENNTLHGFGEDHRILHPAIAEGFWSRYLGRWCRSSLLGTVRPLPMPDEVGVKSG